MKVTLRWGLKSVSIFLQPARIIFKVVSEIFTLHLRLKKNCQFCLHLLGWICVFLGRSLLSLGKSLPAEMEFGYYFPGDATCNNFTHVLLRICSIRHQGKYCLLYAAAKMVP
jgi:hypothetical protein